MGGAIIIDGQLYRGMHNAAGEVGHITIDHDGEPGSSGINGNVESFMSGPYLVHQFRKVGPTAHETLTGEEITRRAGQGDQTARQVLDQAGRALGTAVASLAMILDIELYVIGGSVVNAGNLLLEPARRTVPQFCFQSVAERVRIEPVALGGDGPILGCGWVARQEQPQAG